MMNGPDRLRVPKGTLKILHTKHSLGIHSHQISSWDLGEWDTPSDTLHTHSMGDRFILRWVISDSDMLATISWRELTEEEYRKKLERDRIEAMVKQMANDEARRQEDELLRRISEQEFLSNHQMSRSLREPNDHRADALAYSQISKRGK